MRTIDFPYCWFDFEEWNPMQEKCVPFFTQDKNLVVSATVAAGKTAIAEAIISYELSKSDSKAIYVSPLKALSIEKYEGWRKHETFQSYHTLMVDGDHRVEQEAFQRSRLIIATIESMNICCRRMDDWIKQVRVLVFDEDRMQIQVEVSQLIAEVDRIASQAQFNGMNMLTGRFAKPTGENTVTASMWLHIGANMDQRAQVFIGTMTSQALNLRNIGDEQIMSLASPDDANRAIGTLDEALKKINKQRADLGAYQNRLEHTVNGLNIGAENLQAAESRIRDTDMAKEMVEFTKNQVLTQAGTAMLAQANQSTQSVLSLLQ